MFEWAGQDLNSKDSKRDNSDSANCEELRHGLWMSRGPEETYKEV